MYVFYTVPLTFASQLADPKTLNRLFPGADELTESTGLQLTQLLSGLVTASIWSTFFALCPIIFKVRYNFEIVAFAVFPARRNNLLSL